MTCFKSLLILSHFCMFFPSLKLSKALSDTSDNVGGSYTNISKSTESSFAVYPEKEIVNQSVRECDCGGHSISCVRDIYGRKKCICASGYVALFSHKTYEEECRICDCGRNAISCKAGENSKKECTCESGYAPKISIYSFEENCEECDCGGSSQSCTFNTLGQRKCTCWKGYAPYSNYMNEKCETCDCGIDELSCKLDFLRFRRCTCGGDSVVVTRADGEKCEKCHCGPNSLSCRMMFGGKSCICEAGYVATTISGSLDEECSLPKRDNPSHFPWKTLTYIVTVVYAFIIIIMLIQIFQKCSNV